MSAPKISCFVADLSIHYRLFKKMFKENRAGSVISANITNDKQVVFVSCFFHLRGDVPNS